MQHPIPAKWNVCSWDGGLTMQAAERFTNPATALNQLWQTDFTYVAPAGVGITSRPCSTTSRAISLPSSSAHHGGSRCHGDVDLALKVSERATAAELISWLPA